MLGKTIKRFWKQASIAPAEGGHAVQLDGKGVKTPAGRKLVLPTRALAEVVAAEWDAQETEVRPHTMPMTQLASTALDRVGPEREAILQQLMGYAGTDLLCYRADFPPDLAERQARQWQPLLDWAREALAAEMTATAGVIAIEQKPAALAALKARLDAADTWTLTVIQAAAAAAGSLILALALADRRLNAAETYELSQLEETYQIEKWGEDSEATERRANLKRDIEAAGRLLELLG